MVNLRSKIFVAGHKGLVGSAIIRKLREKGYSNIITVNKKNLDLTNQSQVQDFFSKNNNIQWTMLGAGPDLHKCKILAKDCPNIFFEEKIEYTKLALKIKEADLLLGIFGNSNKAGNVIPNKVFQSLASGKTIITRKSNAYPKEILNLNNGILFIKQKDTKAL